MYGSSPASGSATGMLPDTGLAMCCCVLSFLHTMMPTMLATTSTTDAATVIEATSTTGGPPLLLGEPAALLLSDTFLLVMFAMALLGSVTTGRVPLPEEIITALTPPAQGSSTWSIW